MRRGASPSGRKRGASSYKSAPSFLARWPFSPAGFFLTFFLLFFSLHLIAQENPDDAPAVPEIETDIPPEEAVETAPEKTDEEIEAEAAAKKEKEDRERYINLDIKTATLNELAAWSVELGLGEAGARGDIAARIRQYYNISAPSEAASGKRVITIEKARSTEYFTITTVDEEYARLSGGVQISLKDGDTLYKIKAWDVLFNRTRNILQASGGVEYVKEEGASTEKFTGESIIINIDSWVGDFINTVSERAMEGSETAYRFAGEVISATGEETTVLKNAIISNAKVDEPYWSLNAARLWLLPGSDWAVFNALLKVGEIPVLWLPVFAYPSSEIVFHPVLGTRTREGSYVQTTTYILGRKAPASGENTSSISSILGSGEGMEQVREGLFFRTTKRKDPNPNTTKLSLLLDAYSNLGYYTGLEFVTPKLSVINSFSTSFGIGWTKTIYDEYGIMTTYDPYDEMEEHYEKSYFFGLEVPFRYRWNTAGSISGKYGTINLKFPLYSDPYIDYDVMKRSEDFNWMDALMDNKEDTSSSTLTVTTLPAYDWNMHITPSVTLPQIIKPYLNSFSMTSSSNFNFVPYNSSSTYAINQPREETFFMPNKLTPYSVSTSLGGTLLTLGGSTSTTPEEKAAEPLKGIGEPISPWETEEKTGASSSSGNLFSLTPPALSTSLSAPASSSLLFTLNYSLNPTSSTEMQYVKQHIISKTATTTTKEDAWTTPDDIDWSEFSTITTFFAVSPSTTFTLSSGSFFTTDIRFNGNYKWQSHSFINEDALSDTEIEALHRQEYSGRLWDVNSSYSTTLSPFYKNEIWTATNFKYTLTNLIAKSLFDEQKFKAGSDDPYEIVITKFEREQISTHQMDANFNAKIINYTQSLNFSASLPPLYQRYSAAAQANAWITSTRVNTSLQEDSDEEKKKEKTYHYLNGYIFNNVLIDETFKLGASGSLVFHTEYAPETYEWKSFTSNLTYKTLSSGFTATYGYKYYYDITPGISGWKQKTTEKQELLPSEWYVAWNPSYKFESLFGGYLNLNVSFTSRVNIKLQKYTESNLSFGPNVTMNITKFLDLSLSSQSTNPYIYRYIQDWPIFDQETRDNINPRINQSENEQNFLIDLVNSFRFDNEELRKKSGFKLRTFKFTATHHLGDWDAMLDLSFSPVQEKDSSGKTTSRFVPTFSFYVRWIPIKEIETGIDYKDEKFSRQVINKK
jgi:lipopolysaccharide assembly outer membrane protein LptD (OstA)